MTLRTCQLCHTLYEQQPSKMYSSVLNGNLLKELFSFSFTALFRVESHRPTMKDISLGSNYVVDLYSFTRAVSETGLVFYQLLEPHCSIFHHSVTDFYFCYFRNQQVDARQ